MAEREGSGRKAAEIAPSRIFSNEDLELNIATAFDRFQERMPCKRQASREVEAKVAIADRETDLRCSERQVWFSG